MAHKHGIKCLEIVSGKTVCFATSKVVERRGPRLRSGYAFKYEGPETEWDRIRLSYGDDWDTVVVGESEIKGSKHMGLFRMGYKAIGAQADQVDVWRSKDGSFYAQTPHRRR